MSVSTPGKTVTHCTHCELPVPAGLIVNGRDQQFCCGGCEGAWQLIHDNGLESFYRMADAESEARSLNHIEKKSTHFRDLDDPAFQEKFIRRLDSGDAKIELAIEGMHCGACIWLIEKLPSIVPGIVEATVNWGRRSIRVVWREDQVQLSQIAAKLNQLGYYPSPLRQNSTRDRWQAENRKHLARIGVAAACAGNNMVISAALYLGMFSYMTANMTQLMRVASGIVGIVALLWPGRAFLNSALAAIKTRTPHMDLPIALALLVGTVAGIVNVVRGAGEIYFDSLAVLIFLLLIGRWVQFRQQAKAADSVELLQQLTPQKTRRIVNGEPVEVLVDLVQANDLLQIRYGDLFPVDGTIVESTTSVDESILTGESAPVRKQVGDEVLAGTTNAEATVVMRVATVGEKTRLGRLTELVEQASGQRTQIVQWANQVGGYFVVTVIALAVLTLAWWFPIDVEAAIDRSVALLIVACPCALALATPLAIAVALGNAAKQKIMVKGGDVLQALQRPGLLWLDKTGTVTEGQLRLSRWYGSTQSLMEIAALELQSTHPIADAVSTYCYRHDVPLIGESKWESFIDSIDMEGVVTHPGKGLSGRADGLDVAAGSRGLMAELEIPITRHHLKTEKRILDRNGSPCWFAIAGNVVAIAELMDSIRPESESAIKSLKQRGWEVGILSGDHQQVVNRVAGRLGIEPSLAIGGVTPEEKLAIVQQSDTASVVMVGDGVNDSAALAAASVGIAVKNSAETSLAAAPVYLAKPGLNPILELMSLSDSTTQTMRMNLAVSLAYNIIFAALAFVGYINPLVAAILMPISSITVVALSLTAGRKSGSQS